MAFLRVELHTEDVTPLNRSAEGPSVIGHCDTVVGLGRLHDKAVYEIEISRWLDSIKHRGAPFLPDGVPAHVGHPTLEPLWCHSLNSSRDPAQTKVFAVLKTAVRQKLHSQANAEERRLVADHSPPERLEQSEGLQVTHRLAKCADAGEYDVRC